MIQASACGKVILFGEHAVVHGFPAIAVPVSGLRVLVRVHPPEQPGETLQIVASDLDMSVRELHSVDELPDDPLLRIAALTLRAAGQPVPSLRLEIHSHIPIASGLGSGAAISTAIARALLSSCETELPAEKLNELVYQVESIYHGRPSGIDNTVIVYERPVYFVRGEPIELPEIAEPFTLLIGDSGVRASTRVSVGFVSRRIESEPVAVMPLLKQIGELSKAARHVLQHGNPDMLGPLMNENHRLLREVGVSSERLDVLVAAALEAGALGAKLSGGGMGGNMITLVGPAGADAVAGALERAGAVSVRRTTVQATL